jgi:ABC-type cobalamin/Fe3+-siderophores transport system ATPase subunit
MLDMKTAEKSTIIVAMHDYVQAYRLGDHFLVIEHGKFVPL